MRRGSHALQPGTVSTLKTDKSCPIFTVNPPVTCYHGVIIHINFIIANQALGILLPIVAHLHTPCALYHGVVVRVHNFHNAQHLVVGHCPWRFPLPLFPRTTQCPLMPSHHGIVVSVHLLHNTQHLAVVVVGHCCCKHRRGEACACVHAARWGRGDGEGGTASEPGQCTAGRLISGCRHAEQGRQILPVRNETCWKTNLTRFLEAGHNVDEL